MPAPFPDPVDFATDIFPLLEESCFDCHGPKKQKGNLRLDARNIVLDGGVSGPTILPGDSAGSLLVHRLAGLGSEDQMPLKGTPWTELQLAKVRRWIDDGALWPDNIGLQDAAVERHWAYQPPARPDLPAVQNRQWPRNGIDYFVLAKLESEKLTPAPEADRTTLIRRASLDLAGLPPDPEQVRLFLEDRSPQAHRRMIDSLLASPHYGERWARLWLDQARYADSNGYEKDDLRSVWPYRDWVIDAFNRNLPFNQFTIEQLAGDLLPNPTRDQLIATGFHRNTMVNTEGGTDDEEFRVAAVVDRVNTTFEVFMGTTIGCAQCHNHKYDPFSQKEYYQLFAFFNQTADRGRSNNPQLELITPAQQAQREAVRDQIAPLQKLLDTQTPELDGRLAAWAEPFRQKARALADGWLPARPMNTFTDCGLDLEILGDHSLLAAGATPATGTYTVTLAGVDGSVSALRLEALVDGSLPQKSSGLSEEGDFVLTGIQVTHQAANPPSEPANPKFAHAYASHAMNGYQAAHAIDQNSTSGWSIAAHQEANRKDHRAVFVLEQPIDLRAEDKLVITLQHQSVRQQHLLGRFKFSFSTTQPDIHRTWSALPPATRQLLSKPEPLLSAGEANQLAAYYRSIDPELDQVRAQIDELKKQEPRDIPTTLVMKKVDEPRQTRILIRGSHLSPGEPVDPATPAVLHPWPEDASPNRLTFAQWLTSKENPLLARVIMNRIWAQYFGIGLIETSEEFGTQAEPASHPQLLDWLATEFMRQDWNLKAMHRLITTSATYRQSTQVSPKLYQQDPNNRLLARGPRFRMEAEMVRDNALAVAGLLNPKIGGPSVFPYQPEGIWNSPYSGDRWRTSSGGDQFRRGIYTFWRRTAPYPSFAAFDAPSREVLCERRTRSNTPLQSLVTLNDPAYYAAANAFARQLLSLEATDEERIQAAFRICLARLPNSDEYSHAHELLQEARTRFKEDPKAALDLASEGLGAPPENLDPIEAAAWSALANVLLNLDETLTKG